MSTELRICPICHSTYHQDQNTGGCIACEQLKNTKIAIDLESNDPIKRAAAQKLQLQGKDQRDKFFNIPFRNANTGKVLTCGSCGRPLVGTGTPVCMNELCKLYMLDWERAQQFVKMQ